MQPPGNPAHEQLRTQLAAAHIHPGYDPRLHLLIPTVVGLCGMAVMFALLRDLQSPSHTPGLLALMLPKAESGTALHEVATQLPGLALRAAGNRPGALAELSTARTEAKTLAPDLFAELDQLLSVKRTPPPTADEMPKRRPKASELPEGRDTLPMPAPRPKKD